MREHVHFTSPERGRDVRLAVVLIAAMLAMGLAANLLHILWVLS